MANKHNFSGKGVNGMRTDAMLFNMAEGKGGAKRMDRAKNSQQSFSTGFEAQKKSNTTNLKFQDTYKQVAQSNIRSQKKSDSLTKKNEEEDQPILAENMAPTILRDLFSGLDISGDVPKMQSDADKVKTEDATDVIKDALTVISDVLQLNITQGMDDITLENVSDETVNQFTEIVVALKNIINVLDNSSQTDSASDLPIPNLEQADETASILRTELFKIELGMQMLGFGEKVQQNVAEKMNIPGDTGILQASDPSTLSMAQGDVKRIFGGLLEKTDTDLSVLSRKMQELVNENASDKSISVSVQNIPQKQDQSLNVFNSQTYRTILKIEKKEVVEQVNKDAAEGDKNLALLSVSDPLVASDLKDSQTIQREIAPVLEITGKVGESAHQDQILQTKISNSLSRTLENSVVNQINEKLQSAVRSGITEVRIQLRPESLGEVKLSIRMDGDIVIAKIQVESQQVKQIVESSLQSLKDSLAEQHLQTGSFDVNVGDGWNRHHEQQREEHLTNSGKLSNENDDGVITTDVHSVNGVQNGIETGRRFGDNSIEFFA